MFWGFAGLVILVLAALPLVAYLRRKPMDASARQDAPGQFAQLSGGLTHYRWSGHIKGPIAVCVHGLTTPSYVWDALIPGLAMMDYHVLTYDLYGRGYSDRPPGPQDAEFFVRQLEELLEDQDVDGGILLLGYSMGGAIATAYTAKNPEMLERLILLAPAGLSYAPGWLDRVIRNTPVLGDWLWSVLGGWLIRRGVQGESTTPSEVENIYERQCLETRYRGFLPAVLSSQRHLLDGVQEDAHKAVAATAVPVSAVWGEKDAVISLKGLGKLTEINRTARQTVIPGAPHALAYTHPKEVIAAIQEFLREV